MKIVMIVLLASFKMLLYFLIYMESQCQYCSKETLYSCCRNQCSLCDQPECTTSLPPSTSGYSKKLRK